MLQAHFECLGGVAGDMTLAALIDAGCPSELITALPARLNLPGVNVEVTRVKRSGIAATHVRVTLDTNAPRKHRHLHHITKIIADADLPPRAAENAMRIFTRLAEAEAAVHNSTIEKVHFHEVGADDAIVDIVGACLALEHLNVTRVTCSPIPTGHGTVTCEHGVMPIPAPATARLLIGVPLDPVDQPGEMTTPTGAALMTTLAAEFAAAQSLRIQNIGYGAGTAEWRSRPNLLRVLIGQPAATNAAEEHDSVVVLETQVDDMTGQAVAAAMERVLEAGALDAYITPIIMKKGRPGHLFTALADDTNAAAVEDALLRHTSTLGVRRTRAERRKLARATTKVATRYGEITLKIATLDNNTQRAWPEYETVAAAARTHNVPIAEVQQEALQTWRTTGANTDQINSTSPADGDKSTNARAARTTPG